MRQLASMKVKIGLRMDGRGALYPDFNNLSVVQNADLDWSEYIDVYGEGWQYDKTSGHKENTPDSPHGQQWGMILAPIDFVKEACQAFPGECSIMDENGAKEFYEKKVTVDAPDEEINTDVLQGIKVKQDLGLQLTPGQTNALNPDHSAPGIRKNKRKAWNDLKSLVDMEIVND